MSIDRNIVLVTGAAGWIGRQVCENLQKNGQIVAAFNRVACQGPWSLSYIGGLDCLVSPTDELAELLKRTCTVVHCAGRAHRPLETKQEVAVFEEINVGRTRDLVVACRNAGVARIIFVSSTGVYDWARAPINGASEDGEMRPTTAYASTKLQGERIVSESTLDWRVVRLATVFGFGDKANFARLARSLGRRRFVVPGNGDVRKSVMPIDLAAEVLTRLALENSPKHRLMNVALTDAPTLRGLCDDFSRVCGFGRAPSIPMSVLRFGAVVGGLVARSWPGFPLTTSTLDKLATSTVVDNRRLRETFPDLLIPSFLEALKPSAKYYRSLCLK